MHLLVSFANMSIKANIDEFSYELWKKVLQSCEFYGRLKGCEKEDAYGI